MRNTAKLGNGNENTHLGVQRHEIKYILMRLLLTVLNNSKKDRVDAKICLLKKRGKFDDYIYCRS